METSPPKQEGEVQFTDVQGGDVDDGGTDRWDKLGVTGTFSDGGFCCEFQFPVFFGLWTPYVGSREEGPLSGLSDTDLRVHVVLQGGSSRPRVPQEWSFIPT